MQNLPAVKARNKFTTYLLYAIGEIVLVVIGILIAVSINNWNNDRKDRKAEEVLLIQLQLEFESNLAQLEEKMQIRSNAIRGVLRLLDYADHPEKRKADSTVLFLGQTITAPTFDPIVNDLISAGRLQLLTNDSLKTMLSLWTSEIIQVKEEEDAWKQIRETRYFPYLIKETSFRILLNSYFETGQFDLHLIDKNASLRVAIAKDKSIESIMDILDHPDFEDHIAECAAFHSVANVQSEIMRDRIISILDIIKSQLE